MSTNQPIQSPATIPQDRELEDRRQMPRNPLMAPAWIWRDNASEPTAIRLLDRSDYGVGFVCPIALKVGERFELGLERATAHRTSLCVAYCEFFNADTFRIGAHA